MNPQNRGKARDDRRAIAVKRVEFAPSGNNFRDEIACVVVLVGLFVGVVVIEYFRASPGFGSAVPWLLFLSMFVFTSCVCRLSRCFAWRQD